MVENRLLHSMEAEQFSAATLMVAEHKHVCFNFASTVHARLDIGKGPNGAFGNSYTDHALKAL